MMTKDDQELMNRLSSPMNVGNAPTISAKHVMPKEKPGRPGKILDIATKVTGMVILKRNMPATAR